MNSLPADMPEWFKSLIAEVKKDIESQTAQLKENESKKLAIDEAIQADIKAIFQSEDGVLPEAEVARGVEESLNAFEESVESSDADVYFQVRTSTYLSSLESSYKSQERLEFLRQVYAWQEESKVLLDTFIALQSEDVDAYNAFVQSQNAIKAYVDQTIDSEYYFRDLNLDGDIKGSIELLAGSEPVLAQRLKSSLNALTPAQLAANRGSVKSIAPAIDGYLANQGDSSQKIFQSILEKSIYVLHAMKDVVTGILGSFSEMVTRKDFCTGEELDAGSYTMSVIGFLGDAAELSGLPQFQAGGVLLGLGIGFKKLFDAIMPALRKIGGKIEEIRGVFDLILNVAASRKSEGVKDLVSKVTKLLDSAKKIGAQSTDAVKSFAQTLSKYGETTPNWPDGISFPVSPLNLKKHMATNIDGLTQAAGIKGTHNLVEFNKAAQRYGIKITSTTNHPSVDGLSQIEYQILKADSSGEYKAQIFKKTVYDPAKITDDEVLYLAQVASAKNFPGIGSTVPYNSKAGGISFRVYTDGNGGINNVHPRFENE